MRKLTQIMGSLCSGEVVSAEGFAEAAPVPVAGGEELVGSQGVLLVGQARANEELRLVAEALASSGHPVWDRRGVWPRPGWSSPDWCEQGT